MWIYAWGESQIIDFLQMLKIIKTFCDKFIKAKFLDSCGYSYYHVLAKCKMMLEVGKT